MPNAVKWEAAPSCRGTVLSTQTASLANQAYSSPGSEIDNSVNLDQWGALHVALPSSQAYAAGAYLEFFCLQSLDGSSYEDQASTGNPATHAVCGRVSLTSGTGARFGATKWFPLPPSKLKFQVFNASGVALPSTTPGASAITLYTNNDEIQ